MKYKCLETFSVPEWDEFENCEEGREFIVHEGSIWKVINLSQIMTKKYF